LAKPKLTAEIIILTLIINKMKKVLVVNISTRVTDGTTSDRTTNIEFEPTELNKFLSEGWVIEKYDIVPSNVATNFSIIYQLSS
jgi:hypothetical protein